MSLTAEHPHRLTPGTGIMCLITELVYTALDDSGT